jgi:hypothetical protein
MDTQNMSRSELKKAAAVDLGFFNPPDLPRAPRAQRRGGAPAHRDTVQEFKVRGMMACTNVMLVLIYGCNEIDG